MRSAQPARSRGPGYRVGFRITALGTLCALVLCAQGARVLAGSAAPSAAVALALILAVTWLTIGTVIVLVGAVAGSARGWAAALIFGVITWFAAPSIAGSGAVSELAAAGTEVKIQAATAFGVLCVVVARELVGRRPEPPRVEIG